MLQGQLSEIALVEGGVLIAAAHSRQRPHHHPHQVLGVLTHAQLMHMQRCCVLPQPKAIPGARA